MPIVAEARDGIYETVAEVDLTACVVRTGDIVDYLILLATDAHICTHLARVTAHARGGELDAGRYVPAGGIICVLESETAAQEYET